MPDPIKLLVDSHISDLHREGRRAAARAAARGARRHGAGDEPITIRHATPDDDTNLSLLAALDSARVPVSPVLVAEADGELRAAISLTDGATVADPFRPTAAIVKLLVLWAGHGQDPRAGRLARWLRQGSWRGPARKPGFETRESEQYSWTARSTPTLLEPRPTHPCPAIRSADARNIEPSCVLGSSPRTGWTGLSRRVLMSRKTRASGSARTSPTG